MNVFGWVMEFVFLYSILIAFSLVFRQTAVSCIFLFLDDPPIVPMGLKTPAQSLLKFYASALGLAPIAHFVFIFTHKGYD